MNILWYQKCWNYPRRSKIDTYFHSVITCVHFTFRKCWFRSIYTKKQLLSKHCTLLKSVTDSLTKLKTFKFVPTRGVRAAAVRKSFPKNIENLSNRCWWLSMCLSYQVAIWRENLTLTENFWMNSAYSGTKRKKLP